MVWWLPVLAGRDTDHHTSQICSCSSCRPGTQVYTVEEQRGFWVVHLETLSHLTVTSPSVEFYHSWNESVSSARRKMRVIKLRWQDLSSFEVRWLCSSDLITQKLCKICCILWLLIKDDVMIRLSDYNHSDGTHSLQRIHWWASDATVHFSKSVPMREGEWTIPLRPFAAVLQIIPWWWRIKRNK